MVRDSSSTEGLACRACGSGNLSRLISRFAVFKAEEDGLDDPVNSAQWGDVDENDPRGVARWLKRMERETGEDMGLDFDEVVARMEAGEMPEEFEDRSEENE